MAERFGSPESHSGSEHLRSVAAERKKFFDKLASSPWSWAAAAVMALESQGCATMSEAMGYATLEPQQGGMTYHFDVGQSGSFVGPTLSVESLPERRRAGIANLPEGYYAPDVAARLHTSRASGGRVMDVPPGYIDLEALGFERGNEAFVIVQESHPGQPKSGRQRGRLVAQEAARGLSLMSFLPHRLSDGVKMEWAEVTRYGGSPIAPPPVALTVEDRAANIATIEGAGTTGEVRTSLSCRMTPLSGSLHDTARPRSRSQGHMIEYDLLHGNLDLRPLQLTLSEEKSREYPDRPAQGALTTPYEQLPGLTDLFTAYEVLVAQEESLVRRMHALEAKLPSLQGDEKTRAEGQYARMSEQLANLHVSREYRQAQERFSREISRLQSELASLQARPLPAKEKYDANDLHDAVAQKKWREKHIPELEGQIASLERDMATELARLTPTSLDPLTEKLSGLIEPAKQQLTAAALGALGQNIGTHTEVRILTDIDATRGAIRLVVLLDNPKK